MILDWSDWIKSTKISDLAFFKILLMLETCWELSFMKLAVLFLFIGMITCFLDGPLVIIWMQGLGLSPPLITFCIWLIFFASRAGNTSFILITSSIWEVGLEVCAYDLRIGLTTGVGLRFLKYLEIWLTFF